MISKLEDFVLLFEKKGDAAVALGVKQGHLAMAIKRGSKIIVEHEGRQVISAHIQQIKKWGNL